MMSLKVSLGHHGNSKENPNFLESKQPTSWIQRKSPWLKGKSEWLWWRRLGFSLAQLSSGSVPPGEPAH